MRTVDTNTCLFVAQIDCGGVAVVAVQIRLAQSRAFAITVKTFLHIIVILAALAQLQKIGFQRNWLV